MSYLIICLRSGADDYLSRYLTRKGGNVTLPSLADGTVVPHLSIGPIGQLTYFFSAVRQYRQIDQLVPN